MRIHSPLVFLAIGLAGCASVQGGSTGANQGSSSSSLSICELVSQGLKEGRIARIAATFRTDRSSYAYLINRGCGKDGVLDLHDMEPITQESVKGFYGAGDQRCVEKGTLALCVLEAKIDANVEVVRTRDGKLAAKMLKVDKFEYVDPR